MIERKFGKYEDKKAGYIYSYALGETSVIVNETLANKTLNEIIMLLKAKEKNNDCKITIINITYELTTMEDRRK